MARGKPFAVIHVDEMNLVKQVDAFQRNVRDAFDQVEDVRRGTLVSTVLSVPVSQALSEQLVVVYTGKGGDVLRLPVANLRGQGRGQVLLVANQGTGTVTLAPAGNDTLNGFASVPVNGTAVLWSDGDKRWHEVNGPAGVVYVPSTRSLLSTADITLDGVASNTVDLSANRTVGLANAGAGAAVYGASNDIVIGFTLDAKGRVTNVVTENGLVTLSNDLDVRRLQAKQGTALVAGDFALSAGWGTTATVSNVTSGSRDTRGEITVTSAGTGQAANPTITLTFKNGAFAAAPFALVARNGGSQPAVLPTWITLSATLTITFPGTPIAGQSYLFDFMVMG